MEERGQRRTSGNAGKRTRAAGNVHVAVGQWHGRLVAALVQTTGANQERGRELVAAWLLRRRVVRRLQQVLVLALARDRAEVVASY